MYFRHFVLEAFLGAARVLASVVSEGMDTVPRRVWFPRCGADPSWRDDRGESERLSLAVESSSIDAWFLAHTLPMATIEDAHGFDDRSVAGLTVLLERAVIIDRCQLHHG